MKKFATILFTLLLLKAPAQQSVGIGTVSPNASAALDISSINKGMLVPRMTTAQRNAILSPLKGLLVFDTEYNSYWHHTGAGWKEIAGNAYNADSTLIYGQQGGIINSTNLTANGQILSGNSGFLFDSGGPSGNYGNNETLMASVLPGLDQLGLNVTVTSLSLESPHDSLVIRDSYGNRYMLTGNTTGSYRLYGTVDFIFRSNAATSQAGFAIRWDRIMTDNNHQYDSGQLAGWYFNPSRLYMRGGYNLNSSWAPDSSGKFSFGYGSNVKAKGDNSFAVGERSVASENYSIAIGANTNATGFAAIAMGYASEATNGYALAIGQSVDATGYNAMALGHNNLAAGNFSAAMGTSNQALAGGSFVMGVGNITRAQYAFAMGINNRSKSQGGMAVGLYNDTTNAVIDMISPNNRIFQVGNGTSDATRSNAMTILQNGNIGLGSLQPDKNLVVAKSIRLDDNEDNNGTLSDNALYFGNSSTGEAIASRRTPGGNQWGLDFYTNGLSRMNIANNGLVTISDGLNIFGNAIFQNNANVQSNLTVQNGKGIVRGINSTQQKIQTIVLPVSLTLGANSTTTLPYNWTEAFLNVPVAFIGNIANGSSGGWAEVVMSLATPSINGGVLYIFNPRSTSTTISFNLVIIGIGPA